MVKKVSSQNPRELLTNLWPTMTTSQKKRLLKARGFHHSWAETKSIEEMVKRGGGFVAKDLLDVTKIWSSKTNYKNVIFGGKK